MHYRSTNFSYVARSGHLALACWRNNALQAGVGAFWTPTSPQDLYRLLQFKLGRLPAGHSKPLGMLHLFADGHDRLWTKLWQL